tara:strand:- start:125 stop:292 length:168 start_codon:yes stop_codon:yes gene_type:complete
VKIKWNNVLWVVAGTIILLSAILVICVGFNYGAELNSLGIILIILLGIYELKKNK